MFLNASNVVLGVITVILIVIIFLLTYIFLYTSFYKNKSLKILSVNSVDESLKELYSKNFEVLLHGDFIKNLEESYPKVFNQFDKLHIKDSILYKNKNKHGKKILVLINWAKENEHDIFINKKHVHGSNVCNQKSLFYVICESINNQIKKEDIDLNLSVLIYKSNHEVFEQLDSDYDLIINDNGEILDPVTSKLRSYYAFISVLNTGSSTINFTTDKISNGKSRLNEFMRNSINDLNKTRLSKPIMLTLRDVGKDMLFSDRIIAINPMCFSPFVKNLLHESNYPFIYGMKTKIKFQEIVANDDIYSCQANIELGVNESLINVLKTITPYMNKYSINYEIIDNITQTDYINNDNKDLKIFKKIINETFSDVYIASSITKGSKDINDFSLICKTMIGFSPLYYSHNAKINYINKNEYISCGSLVYGIEFYTHLFEEYIRRNKCIVELAEEK